MADFLSRRLTKAKSGFRDYNERINWLVIVFLTVFAISSWIDLQGVWVELPIMIHELPEGWRLPSILVLMMQLSQIGPVTFLLFKWLLPKRISYVFVIYLILVLAATSCFLLCFFWNKTVLIGGEERTIGLYILTFTLGLLDGTSTVAYLAYIGTVFQKEYIIANYLGESLSAMIPGVVGMIQGAGKDLGCRNVTVMQDNTSLRGEEKFELEQIPFVPAFSVSIYFFFLFVTICLSTIAFSFAHYLPLSRKAKRVINDDQNAQPLTGENKLGAEFSNEMPSKIEQITLLFITTGSTFLLYGILPALQSYSTLPYGNNVFHLSITLCLFLLPLSTFLSTWSNNLSTLRISIEFLIGTSFAVYIIAIATLSPCPILLGSWLGPAMILISWMLCQMLFMRIRYCISAKLERCGESVLLLIGTFAIAGQVIGGVLMFILVDLYRLFNDVPSCVQIKDFCLDFI